MDRRQFVQAGVAVAAATGAVKAATPAKFWPNGARLVVSLSLQMETGGQPERGANGPWGNLDTRYPDLPTD